MNCNDVRENLIELLAEGQADPAVATHVRECGNCTRELESLRKTMALLDEWEAPEPTPYFLTRLQANMRSEQEKQPAAGWLGWLRRPWLATALAMMMVAGSGIYLYVGPSDVKRVEDAQVGAVNDLESLDKNHDLYVNSALLDELSGAAPEDASE